MGGGVLLPAYVSNNPGLNNLTGFNSGRYDINAMKIDFFSHLTERNLVKYAVKRNNTFMAVKTEKLKFLDIANYLAPGFSIWKFRFFFIRLLELRNIWSILVYLLSMIL